MFLRVLCQLKDSPKPLIWQGFLALYSSTIGPAKVIYSKHAVSGGTQSLFNLFPSTYAAFRQKRKKKMQTGKNTLYFYIWLSTYLLENKTSNIAVSQFPGLFKSLVSIQQYYHYRYFATTV